MKRYLLSAAALAASATAVFVSAGPIGSNVIEEKFHQYDTNQDGALSGAELEASPLLSKLDLDKNGKVTLEEAQQALRGKTESAATQVVRNGLSAGLFKQLDKNGDGKLTAEELPRKQWFNALDQDRNGEVTFEEAQGAIAKLRREGAVGAVPTDNTPVKPASEDPALTEAPTILKPSDHGVGRLLPDIELSDLDGKALKLSGGVKDREGLVIAFFGASCPVSGKLAPELSRLESEAKKYSLNFWLVCPVAAETEKDIRDFVAAHKLQSPVIHDRDGRLSALLNATTTTEVFLVDSKRTLVYRGAINDQYGLGYSKEAPNHEYLRDAAAAMMKHEAPLIAATSAPGCALDERHAAAASANATASVTYHNRISRILQANCVECHHDGGVGPFSLETYNDVIEHAGMMRKQVDRGAMPPWFAAVLPGQEHSPWANDRSLSVQDKTDLLAWLTGDRPEGDVEDAPAPREFAKGWTLGKPDAVVQLPQPIDIKAEGTMPYQFVTVETSFPEDRWVQAYEIVPTDRSVVHHVIVQVHPKGEKISRRGEGAEGYWAAYVPGNASHRYPDGFAKKLPAGATISFQIHYTPNGKFTKDQLKMGLTFAREAPRYVVHTAAIANLKLNIPAGEAHHVETASKTLPVGMNITACMAHMHVRGKAFKAEATYPDGKTETLIDMPRYDFNWQIRYEYAMPKYLPGGTKVTVTCVYDNSANNPANPDPAKNVRWGQQTSDEMMIGYFEYYTPVSGDVAGL